MSLESREPRKVKVGTILDREIVQRLKERSAKEGRPISALIEDAVTRYDQVDIVEREVRMKAIDRLFSIKFSISEDDLRAIMEEEMFDQ
jgi:hypothetical protein